MNTVYMYIQLHLALGAVIDATLTGLDKRESQSHTRAMKLIDVKRAFELNPAVKIVHSEDGKFTYDVQGYRREVWLSKDRYGLDQIVLATPADVIYLNSLDELGVFVSLLG